ncbi:helix-turn-helix transcriptional regulator [Streptomyces orinoci]|uniref:Helix-turn-helix transcriptional regulator n=1 Tax=Streptomyces orinoci TaxID=67339 RepID=A0ABV3JT05_STRON|nr:helix-turn-helix transcriptional regulator [Streptomyces orinoci]
MTPLRVLPDGCLDLIWTGERLLVAGPDTGAHLVTGAPGGTATGVRLAPGTGPALLGVPAAELRDLRVPLADLWPEHRVRPLHQRMAESTAPGRALEEALRPAEDAPWPGRDPLTAGLLAGARRGRPVSALAAQLGVGERRLHRHSLQVFGYGPKMLTRILRMRQALTLARAGHPFAQLATTCGYADQSHLAREIRALTGVPLRELIP